MPTSERMSDAEWDALKDGVAFTFFGGVPDPVSRLLAEARRARAREAALEDLAKRVRSCLRPGSPIRAEIERELRIEVTPDPIPLLAACFEGQPGVRAVAEGATGVVVYVADRCTPEADALYTLLGVLLSQPEYEGLDVWISEAEPTDATP